MEGFDKKNPNFYIGIFHIGRDYIDKWLFFHQKSKDPKKFEIHQEH